MLWSSDVADLWKECNMIKMISTIFISTCMKNIIKPISTIQFTYKPVKHHWLIREGTRCTL